jgi:hypothetical protein
MYERIAAMGDETLGNLVMDTAQAILIEKVHLSWFIIDSTKAEPEINYSGEFITSVQSHNEALHIQSITTGRLMKMRLGLT